jgi:deoxyhypusine monooxygenase
MNSNAAVDVTKHSDSHSSNAQTNASTNAPTVKDLQLCLKDEKAPIAKRMRSVFLLRQKGGKEAIDALASGFGTPSVLLGHEIAFVMGQMRDPLAVPYLTKILENKDENAIVRHEAAEALGAIGLHESLSLLEKYASDSAIEVADTCKIAVDRLKWNIAQSKKGKEGEAYETKYDTADPAPASKDKSTESLKKVLADASLSLFERYRAMFALRNKGDKAAVEALAVGFDDKSAVFRHEVAYVMGQIQHIASVPFLSKMLENKSEHAMVRHEAAEALGAIAADSCAKLLAEYQKDKDLIVSQSCDVALDIADYWASDELEGETDVSNENSD